MHGEPGTLWLHLLHSDAPPQVGSIGGQSALPPQLSGLLDLLAAEGGLPTANITAAGNKTLARMRRQVGGAGRCLVGVAGCTAAAVMWREGLVQVPLEQCHLRASFMHLLALLAPP